MAELDTAVRAYADAQETANRATATFPVELAAAGQAVDDFKMAVDNMATAVSSRFEDAILDFKGYRDAMEALGKDIQRILLRAAVTKPLERALEGGGFGGGGFGGMLGDMFVGMFSSLFGGAGATQSVGAIAGSDVGARIAALTPHGGGVVGRPGIPTRLVPAGTFARAPRLHRGLRADEFPAVLQRGETVTPRGGGRGVQVIVNDHRGAGAPPVSVREQAGPGGVQQIVIGIVAENIGRGGEIGRAIKGTFGLTRIARPR